MLDYLSYLKGKRVLITGGAGTIGNVLVKKLLQLKAYVIVIDNLSSGFLWNLPTENKNLLFIEGDITNDIDLKRIFYEKPDIIFHLAAFFANPNSINYPEKDLDTNGLGTLKLLEYSSVYNNLERFVYSSSSSIYPSNGKMPYNEGQKNYHFRTPYQITKLLGELYCNFYYHHNELPITIARFFNSYGPGEIPGRNRNVIANFFYWALQGKSLPITGTGEETRDFTYVEDIVDGLLRMAYYKQAIGEVFNLGTGREVKIMHLAETINKITGNNSGVKILPRRPWDNKLRVLSSSTKAKELLYFNPTTTLEQGLNKTVIWFKQNWDKIIRSTDLPNK
ncbi:UDP-glucose 4-epimerase [Caldisalinibacter kiritimatiensis]|uniref:UDP-glucose 4-epimerase n=2 Tax=Caldisalinibacter kiritimatiensis TaxID=1304284 RepID=R1CCF6_9FIRM|nr:UDP-glucose 4-epimerase [Caldisalinibacter kiritimatiensis]